MNSPGSGGADVGFAERLLEVIDSGRRTATYKLALLIALLDRAPGTMTPAGGHLSCCTPGTSPSKSLACTGRR